MDKRFTDRQPVNRKLPAQFSAVRTKITGARLEHMLRLVLEAMAARGLNVAKDLAGFGITKPAEPGAIPGWEPGGRAFGRRVGGEPPQTKEPGLSTDGTEFKDPLASHRHQRPRSTMVGAPDMPGKDSLSRQDTDYSNGPTTNRRGTVWHERSTERDSVDGSNTWGSTMYRDTGGNHWRVDYHDERHDDGTVTSKETVFDSHNEPIKTTLRESHTDGTATETTTTHATGETQTRSGTMPEIFPEGSQTGEETGRRDAVAPRGWYNPITGVTQNPGLATNNNQINPGREQSSRGPTSTTPLLIDSRILVVNPAPDQAAPKGTPRRIQPGDGPTIIDPPRP